MSMGGVDWRGGRARQPLSFPSQGGGMQMPFMGGGGKGPMPHHPAIAMQGGTPPTGPRQMPLSLPVRGGMPQMPMPGMGKGPMPHNPAIAMQGAQQPTGPRQMPLSLPVRGGGQMGGWLPPWLQGMF